MTALLQRGIDFQKDFDGQTLANVAWALSKLDHNPGDDFMKMVMEQTKEKVDTFAPANMGNVLYTIARFGVHTNDEFREAVTQQVRATLHEFGGKNAVEHVLWAFAKMDHNPGGDLIDGLLAQWETSVEDGSPQGFATILWACSVLEHKPDAGFCSLAMNVTNGKLDQFRPQGLANALWAFATSNVTLQPGFLSHFFDASEASLPRFSARYLTKILLACGELKQCRGRFLDKLIETSRDKLQEFRKNQLAANAKVCKQFGHAEGHKLFRSALHQRWTEEKSTETA